MNRLKISTLFVILIFGTMVFAQTDLPFKHGEKLTFEAKIDKYKVLRGISVAQLTFAANQTPATGEWTLTGEAVSKGTLIKILGFSFLQQFTAYTASDLTVYKAVKHDQQKDRIRKSDAVFDYKDKQVVWTETDPASPNKPPRIIASPIPVTVFDVVASIYKLRTLPLKPNETFSLSVSDSGLVYTVPVRVIGRERLKTNVGTFSCFKLEPQVFGKDRLIDQKGSMFIWITDDARRLPVRGIIDSSVGKLDIKIKTAENLK